MPAYLIAQFLVRDPEKTAEFRQMAKAAGRDPSEAEVIVRALVRITPEPLGADRWSFTGSLEQIRGDIDQVRRLGVEELFFDPTFSPDGQTSEAFLACLGRLRELV